MKVIYSFYYNPNLPGVNKKIIAKIKWLQDLGVDITLLCFTDQENHSELNSLRVIYVRPIAKGKLPRIFNLKYLSFINQIVQNYKSNIYFKNKLKEVDFDFLILRYGTANYFSYKLTKYFKYKFVFEHNTLELDQLKLKYNGLLKSQSWISYSFFSEKYFGPKSLTCAAGLIGVTNEITNYEKKRMGNKSQLPLATTISNGINVGDYPLNNSIHSATEINLVMILGVTAEWHGLNRIIEGLNNYMGNRKITLFIIGNVTEIKCPNAVYLGYMSSLQMNDFFNTYNIHIGIASLALHRISITEASVLKAREYLARGIPFIYGYNDTDLENEKDIAEFVYKVPANDSTINMEQIISFYDKVKQVTDYPEKIRNFAEQKVDMQIKMNQYVSFLNSIYSQNK
jgi:hypothetical protein